jgi:hypothetical protein
MPRRYTRKNNPLNFWKQVERAIRLNNVRRGEFAHVFPKWNQRGGDIITVNGHSFEYIPSVDGDQILIRGGKTDNNLPCFRLTIDSSGPQTFANLEELIKGTSCSLEGWSVPFPTNRLCVAHDTAKTQDMVHAIIQIAKNYGAKWIELADESGICKKGGLSIPLSNYYMLTKGKTWYEYYFHFQPDDAEFIQFVKERVTTNSWNNVIRWLQPKRQQAILRDLHADISDIDINRPGSALIVLNRIPYEARCNFYRKHMNLIFEIIGIGGIKGTKWFLLLTADAHRPTLNEDEE